MKLICYDIVIEKDKMNDEIEAICEKYKVIKEYAYILHDKDTCCPHYHVYLGFLSSCDFYIGQIGKWFKSPKSCIFPIYNKTKYFEYLLRDFSTEHKRVGYSIEDIIANFDVKKYFAKI